MLSVFSVVIFFRADWVTTEVTEDTEAFPIKDVVFSVMSDQPNMRGKASSAAAGAHCPCCSRKVGAGAIRDDFEMGEVVLQRGELLGTMPATRES
ncbi:hypothetical protein ACFL6C_04250 [Myxococcota bacterium]